MTCNFKANLFYRILDKTARWAKPVGIIGDPSNQRPDTWNYAVLTMSERKCQGGGGICIIGNFII
jgi:hypothetical protein